MPSTPVCLTGPFPNIELEKIILASDVGSTILQYNLIIID